MISFCIWKTKKKLDCLDDVNYRKQNTRVILGSGDGEGGGRVFLAGQGGSSEGRGKSESKGVGQREVLCDSPRVQRG